MDNLIGQNLGRYHVIEPLGQGGMASVYKAYDNSLERNVAIKIIRTDKKEGTEQNEFLKRFQREAKALAQLDHPYILKVLDYGEQNGIPYLIMPFVQGGTLKERMGHPMPYREAAALLAPVAQALNYAHRRMIIHRDVKPANILIDESNTPILSDFGIAKILESSESTQLTATGVGIGTPDYMAPEQWMGKADQRTDIYSLGIVFFQMVTGRLPFSAETPAAVLIKHMQDPLPRPGSLVPGLPEAVEQVIFKALAKEPENRFQDMGAFAEALGRLAQGDPGSLAAISQGMETVLSGATRVQAPGSLAETVLAPVAVPAKKRKMTGWQIGLIVVAAIAVVVLALSLLAGGIYLASRATSQLKPTTGALAVGASTQGISSTTVPSSLQPLKTEATSNLQPLETQTATSEALATLATPFVSIPGFPSDIPIYPKNNGDLMTTVDQQGGGTVYLFTSNSSLQEITDFYKSGMASNGWQTVESSTGSGMNMWVFSKGDSSTVSIALLSKSEKPVQVMISIQQIAATDTP